MARTSRKRSFLTTLAVGVLASQAPAQFVINTTDIPQGNPANNSRSENVDFADIDLDGDWDAAFADGGDVDQDQNRIWVNMGGLQAGTVGVFSDQTSTRCPAHLDQSRDIEFADIDNDGDPDIYVSNTSAIVAQTNRWWVNQGNAQAGTIGFYVDETSTRWVNLGTAGSSIPVGAVFPSGGFRDWSCDCDFGDLDNDGDIDLVHSSYGGAFGGQVPTRIFLNNGAGFFQEFNPSGFQLTGDQIMNGNPGIWCEGTQQSNTTNSTGVQCDIASSALDIDVGDVDGDFDLDILHGARQEAPRMFFNRYEENGHVLGFRDVTGAVFPPGYTAGNGHYEEEMGDLDGDGDLDIYGLNWLITGPLNDITLRNVGDGTFDSVTVLPGSGSDDNEGDFLDYDCDGDLDLFVANFSGQDRLYRNNNNGGASFSYTNVTSSVLPTYSNTGLDADCCDVDNDGDYDVFVANDGGQANVYLENTSQCQDTSPPYIPHLEQLPNTVQDLHGYPIRAHVYDNAAYYITWYNPTVLNWSLNGVPQTPLPMRSSAGQMFRGVIPGSAVGVVEYSVTSQDHYGNTGNSITRSFTVFPSGPGMPSCFGDGCPCGNDDSDAGCVNSTGSGAQLLATGSVSVAADDLVLTTTGCPPNNTGLYFMGASTFAPVFVGDGLACTGGLFRYFPGQVSSMGVFTQTTPVASSFAGAINPGDTRHFQSWTRDVLCGPPPAPCPSPCGQNSNISNAYSVTFQP